MSFWSWLMSLFGRRRPPEKRIISLVLLLREERYLDPIILRKLATNAFGIEFDDSDEAENFVVTVQEDVNYMIQAHGQMFLVNNYPRPYIEDLEEVSEEIQELRLRQAFLDHRAWLSVDRFGPVAMSEDVSFHWIGRLIAELADTDCTAIFCPANSRGCVYETDLEEILRGPHPLQIFESNQRPPVLEISENDPLMLRAVEEARARWPEFVTAFEERQSGDVFSVKAPLSDGEATEFMWLSVGAIENDIIFGRLDNDPVSIGRIKSGDRVRVAVADLNDWLYTLGNQQHGGFTVAVLTRLYRKGK
ncbi:MAG: DUF2314 domain-containing protein [Planctomycetota bacterium]